MKRIKDIINALNTLGMDPAVAIREAYDRQINGSHSKADDHLMDSIVNAVAAIAEDMEKAAKSE